MPLPPREGLPLFAPAPPIAPRMAPRMALRTGAQHRARLEALMREIGQRLRPDVIRPRLHESGAGGREIPGTGAARTSAAGLAPRRRAAAQPAGRAGAVPGLVMPTTATVTMQTGAPGGIADAAKLARNLKALDNIRNLGRALLGSGAGSHLAAAAQLAFRTGDLGPLLRAAPLAWNYGTPAAVPPMADLAGAGALDAVAAPAKAAAAAAGGAAALPAGAAEAASLGFGSSAVPGISAAGGAAGGAAAGIGGIAAASPLMIAAPMFLMGLRSRMMGKDRGFGVSTFNVQDGQIGLGETGADDGYNEWAAKAFGATGARGINQALADVGGTIAGDSLPGRVGTDQDRGGWFYQLGGVDSRLYGFDSVEDATRAYALDLARQGKLKVDDLGAFNQALIERLAPGAVFDAITKDRILAPLFEQSRAGLPEAFQALMDGRIVSGGRYADPLSTMADVAMQFGGGADSIKDLLLRQRLHTAPGEGSNAQPISNAEYLNKIGLISDQEMIDAGLLAPPKARLAGLLGP